MKTSGVVAFAFGAPYSIRSNRLIAKIASQTSRDLGGATVFTQNDINPEMDIACKYIEEESGNPPPTLRIARAAVKWAKRNEISELWVSAAHPHVWRCVRDLERAVQEECVKIEIKICGEVANISHYSEWFCSNSTQDRTRSEEKWDKRERILRWLPFFIYKLIAS